MDWMNRKVWFHSGRERRFFSLPQGPDQHWGSLNFLSNGYWGLFLWELSGWGVIRTSLSSAETVSPQQGPRLLMGCDENHFHASHLDERRTSKTFWIEWSQAYSEFNLFLISLRIKFDLLPLFLNIWTLVHILSIQYLPSLLMWNCMLVTKHKHISSFPAFASRSRLLNHRAAA
jgi:hypothetical protein